ncbi:hypothetical protein PENTCL1PPCAC_22639, partial [Pristionchus entomophagus]
SLQSEVPMAGSVAKMVNRLSKVEDPILKITEPKKQFHIVVYEYKSQQADEIDMEVNDIIEIIKTVEDGWNRGKNERTGQIGMYPTNYCEVYRTKPGLSSTGTNKQYISLKKADTPKPIGEIPAAIKRISGMDIMKGKEETPSSLITLPSISSSPPNPPKEEQEKDGREYAKVTFDYVAQHEDELSLKVGQTVWVVNKRTTDSGWYEGEVDGRRGLFPDNFVSLMKPSSGNGSSLSQPPPFPPTTLSSLTSSTPSLSTGPPGRLGDKPPASLPGAISVMPLPPQVPAKPPKNMGGMGNGVSTSTTSTTTSTGGVGWKMGGGGGPSPSMSTSTPSITSTTSATSSSAITLPVTAPSTSPSVVKEEEKEVLKPAFSSFQDKKANLLASLHPSSLNPSIPRPMSKSTTKIDQEGLEAENGDYTAKETPLLSHPTKNRPKVPSGVRRPVSMFPPPPSDFTTSISKDGMTRSEVVTDRPAPIGSSTSLSPSALSISPPLPPKEKDAPSTMVCSSRSSSTGTPTPVHSTNHNSIPEVPLDISQSQWVSRSEYNQLLEKVALLEERLERMERR